MSTTITVNKLPLPANTPNNVPETLVRRGASGEISVGNITTTGINVPVLTDATTVNADDELIIQQGGITKRATGAELAKGLNAMAGSLNVKDFGAIPDWNGSTGTDNTAAFTNALNAVNAQGGGTLSITEPGAYKISSTIWLNVTSNIEIVFSPGSKLVAAPSMQQPVLLLQDDLSTQQHVVVLRNANIDCSLGSVGSGQQTCSAVYCNGLKAAIYENINLYGGTNPNNTNADSGINGAATLIHIVDGGVIQGFADGGIYLNGTNDSTAFDSGEGISATVSNVTFRHCNNAILAKRELACLTVNACTFYQCNAGIIPAEITSSPSTLPGRQILVHNSVFRQIVSNAVRVRGPVVANIVGNVFEDIGIENNGSASTASVAALVMQGSRNAVVSSNIFTVKQFAQVPGCRAADFSNLTILGTTYTFGNNLFCGNVYKGLSSAIKEGDGGGRNFYIGEFADVTEDVFDAASSNTSRWSYQSPTESVAVMSPEATLKFFNRSFNQKWSLGSSGSSTFLLVDESNGNAIPFRIEAAAPSNSLRVSSSGSVGVGTTANTSAQLDVQSTTRGLLPPRMTQTQRDAISSPATGLLVYNTTTNKINFYNGSHWEAATSS